MAKNTSMQPGMKIKWAWIYISLLSQPLVLTLQSSQNCIFTFGIPQKPEGKKEGENEIEFMAGIIMSSSYGVSLS